MKEVLQIIKEYKEIGNTEDLVLDDTKVEHFTPELKHEMEQLAELAYLSMNNCGLKSLNHFPALKNLITLELSENDFPARELSHLKDLAGLRSLDLDCIKIDSLHQLEPLKELKNLQRLEINDCEFVEEPANREKIFKLLPQLEVLNGEDKEGNPVDYSDEEEFSDEEGSDEEEEDESEEDEEGSDEEEEDEESD